MWWSLVTMSKTNYIDIKLHFFFYKNLKATVGYGDKYPFSIMGKVLAGITALLGIIMIALPVAIMGSNF